MAHYSVHDVLTTEQQRSRIHNAAVNKCRLNDLHCSKAKHHAEKIALHCCNCWN